MWGFNYKGDDHIRFFLVSFIYFGDFWYIWIIFMIMQFMVHIGEYKVLTSAMGLLVTPYNIYCISCTLINISYKQFIDNDISKSLHSWYTNDCILFKLIQFRLCFYYITVLLVHIYIYIHIFIYTWFTYTPTCIFQYQI